MNFEATPSGFGGNYPGPSLIVNGSGRWGLRIEGKGDYLTNLLTAARLESLTGSGGVLTFAATDASGSMTIANGPASNSNGVRLGLIGNLGFTYILNAGTVANFGGILVKQGRVNLGNGLDMTGKNLRVGDEGAAAVALDDSATATMNQLVLIGVTTHVFSCEIGISQVAMVLLRQTMKEDSFGGTGFRIDPGKGNGESHAGTNLANRYGFVPSE